MSSRVLRCLWVVCAAPLPLAGCSTDPGVAFSPDGRRLVVARGDDKPLCLVENDGRLDTLPGTEGGRRPGWAPDGERVLFAVGEDAAFYDVAAGRAQRLANDASPPYAWSADSRQFTAFHSPEDGVLELCWYRFPEGDVERRVRLPFSLPSLREPPVWLSDRGDVALLGCSDEGCNVYTVEDGVVHQITHTNDVLGVGRSPDGQHLVWVRSAPHVQPAGLAVWLYDLKDRSASRLPFPARLAPLGSPRRAAALQVTTARFSPDGTHLAVVAASGSSETLYSGRVDGVLRTVQSTSPSRPREADDGSLSFCWSPDSRRLAVWKTGDTSAVRLYRASGGGRKTLSLPDTETE